MNVNGHELTIKSNGNHKLYINGIHIFSDTSLLAVRNFRVIMEARIAERVGPFRRTFRCSCGHDIVFTDYYAWDCAMHEMWASEVSDKYCPACGITDCVAKDCSNQVGRDMEYGLCYDCHDELKRDQKEHEDHASACWGCYHDWKEITGAHLFEVEMENGSKELFCSECFYEVVKEQLAPIADMHAYRVDFGFEEVTR